MKLKLHNNISESQVEDSFVANLVFLKKILNLSSDLKLIARQLRLKNGDWRIDLLVSSGQELCLIELKVTRFSDDYLSQIIDYRDELIRLQDNGELISGKIISYLLVTDATKKQIESANKSKVHLIIYNPID